MHVVVRRTRSLRDAAQKRQRVLVTAEALDHEGIVHAVAGAIERLGVSIASLETACYPAPLSGGPLFRLEAKLELPVALDIDALRRGLEPVAESENLELDVRSLDG